MHTCSLNVIFSSADFLAKLDRNDNGKTKAALPTITRPSNIALTATDVPGLHYPIRRRKRQHIKKWLIKKQEHASKYCPLYPVTYHCQPHGFKTHLLGRGFHTLIKNALFPSLTDVRSHNPTPWGPVSLLAHHPMPGSDTICNSSSPLLVDIVCFGPLRITINLMVLKRVS